MHNLARPADITTFRALSCYLAGPLARWRGFRSAVLLMMTIVLGFSAAPAQAMPEFVDAVNYPAEEQGWDAFYGLENRLVRNFDDICGDTVCEGDFSNMQALRYRCSVRLSDGMMGECVWTFAGSNAEVSQATGKIMVDTRTWTCRTPLAPQTPVATFYSALSGAQPVLATLPGTSATILDGLMRCLI